MGGQFRLIAEVYPPTMAEEIGNTPKKEKGLRNLRNPFNFNGVPRGNCPVTLGLPGHRVDGRLARWRPPVKVGLFLLFVGAGSGSNPPPTTRQRKNMASPGGFEPPSPP